MAITGKRWTVLRPFTVAGGPVGGSQNQTCVVETVARDDRTTQVDLGAAQESRPPRMGEWYIESIGSRDADGTFDVA